mgnify:FL=1
MQLKLLVRQVHISIHPPREGWDPAAGTDANPEAISIHPPREGWDFLTGFLRGDGLGISIHPPREGWDQTASTIS